MKTIIIISIFALQMTFLYANEVTQATLKLVNIKYLPKSQKDAEIAVEKLKIIANKSTLTRRDKQKIEELKKLIEVYNLWIDYKNDVEILQKSKDYPSKLRAETKLAKYYPAKYLALTNAIFPKPYKRLKNRIQTLGREKALKEEEKQLRAESFTSNP